MYVPEKDEHIIVYCKSGKRSVFGAESLQKLGYQNIHWVTGGWEAWYQNFPKLKETAIPAGHGPVAEQGGC